MKDQEKILKYAQLASKSQQAKMTGGTVDTEELRRLRDEIGMSHDEIIHLATDLVLKKQGHK